MRVLHVDDEPCTLEISKQIMMDMDASLEFDSACCVDEAFKKIAIEHYDVIISDYEMPQKNGLQFLKELREQKKEIPFVLFTGKGREEVAIKALNLGADGYYNKNGSPETVYGELYHGIRMAVTRKATEAALVDAQTLTSSIINSTRDMIWSVSAANFRLLTFNESMSDYFFRTQNLILKVGMTQEEIMPTEKLVHTWLELNKRALREGSFTIEYTTLKEPRVLELTFNLLKRGEEVFGIAVFGKDITERKNTEDALLAAGEKFRTIFENVNDVITYVDTHGKILDVNDRVEDLLGYKREEIIGKNFVKLGLIRFKDAPKLLKLFFGSLRKGEEKKIIVLELKHKNGGKVSVEVGTRFIRNNKGKIVGVVNIFRDITKNKKAEEALRASEERFRQFMLSSPDVIHLLDPNSRKIKFLNRDEFLGYSCAELEEADSIIPWLHPDDRELVQGYYQSVLNGAPDSQKPVEYRLKNKAGYWEWIQSRTTILKYNDQNKPEQILVTLTLITEQKKVEESLKESEEKFRNLAEESPNIIFINKHGKVVYANKKCEEITGYLREEFYSPNFNFLSLCAPEYVEEVKSFYSRHLNGEAVPPYDYVLVNKNGKKINVISTTKLMKYEGETAILGIMTDITERKKAEENLNRTMNELANANEKLAVVGNLTRHDVRNKLMVVGGNIFLLKKSHSENAEIMERLWEIEQACRSIVNIFDFAKMYEQLGVEEHTLVDLGNAIDEAAALFPGLTLKIVNECYGKKVLADSFLRQMFYNFIDNTKKYGAKATTIKVYYEKEISGGLRLIYEDDGVGISEENKSKLFKEGFSTGGSTGFGLFLIKKMMDVYGWTITEEGVSGKGAKFVITIASRN